MTTQITIDAHAGWDIEVTTKTRDIVPAGLERMGPPTYTEKTFIVKAGTKHVEAIWDNKSISGIRELKRL